MKKIVLFFPPPFSSTRPYNGPPLGLLGISRQLDAEGYPIKIVTAAADPQYAETIVKECEGAICLGISSMTGYQIHEGRLVAQRVKERYPELPIVWGGWHPSILPMETLADPYVDIVAVGQGERTFYELVKCLEQKGDLSTVKGIGFKRDGKLVANSPRGIEPLDNFPPLPYHLLGDIETYIGNNEYGKRSLFYYSSYGCPHRCGFCIEEAVNNRGWKSLSAEKVADEVEGLVKKYGLDSLNIVDSNFFVDRQRVKRLCELLVERGVKIRWGNVGGRASTLIKYDEETWKLLEQSGWATVLVGVESGDQETLDFMKKDTKVEDFTRFAELCARHHVKIFGSYVIGFPWSKDPEECRKKIAVELKADIALMKKLYTKHPWTRNMIFQYLPYPGTTLMDDAVQLGITLPTSLEGWSKFLISPEEVNKMEHYQKWVSRKHVKMIPLLSTYIFFFLDRDSYEVYVKGRVKNPLVRLGATVMFYAFSALAHLRWKFEFFALPIDFYFYTLTRKYAKVG
ncbi:MAG: cobalamin-dependent protein [Spirochaetes bacterium]|nr:cobalamin-dependent protein [Spirochaetota bacterium]